MCGQWSSGRVWPWEWVGGWSVRAAAREEEDAAEEEDEEKEEEEKEEKE